MLRLVLALSTCLGGMAAASAASAELICHAYDLEGRLRSSTRDNGSRLEYSFLDQVSGVLDRNDNREQLIQTTNGVASCSTAGLQALPNASTYEPASAIEAESEPNLPIGEDYQDVALVAPRTAPPD